MSEMRLMLKAPFTPCLVIAPKLDIYNEVFIPKVGRFIRQLVKDKRFQEEIDKIVITTTGNKFCQAAGEMIATQIEELELNIPIEII